MIFEIIPAALALCGGLLSLITAVARAVRSARAERQLLTELKHDAKFQQLALNQDLTTAAKVAELPPETRDALVRIILERLEHLPAADQQSIRDAVEQETSAGRLNYLSKVATEATESGEDSDAQRTMKNSE